ncbi:hypothetical protein CRM22_001682, partial [Opisthorchis felineus]
MRFSHSSSPRQLPINTSPNCLVDHTHDYPPGQITSPSLQLPSSRVYRSVKRVGHGLGAKVCHVVPPSTPGLTDSDFGILDSTEEQDLVQVILSRHGQQHLYGINSHLQMPNMTQHSYEIRSNLRGFLVSQVPFTCSSQLSPIISLLRQHASASAFLETFVLHPRKPVVKDDSLTFHFAVTIESTSLVHVQFDHPCDVNRTVQ